MVEIDPDSVYDGPVPYRDGTVEIHSWLPSSSGTLQRVTRIDAARAWVVEQHVYDPSGQTLLASAVAESHRYYPAEQVSLPQRVSLRLPTAGLALEIDLGRVQINQLAGDPNQLWALPALPGYPHVDLSNAAPGAAIPGRPPGTAWGQSPPTASGNPAVPWR
jgi:hypothetical protein